MNAHHRRRMTHGVAVLRVYGRGLKLTLSVVSDLSAAPLTDVTNVYTSVGLLGRVLPDHRTRVVS